MSEFRPPHEMHQRRFGRNVGVGLLLAALIGVVFALTVVKVTRGDPMQDSSWSGGTGRGDGVLVVCSRAVLSLVLRADRIWRHDIGG
jgi:hypothetical protein